MLVKVEFHFDCARTSVRRFHTVALGASIDFVTEIASRNVVRLVVALPSWSAVGSPPEPGTAVSYHWLDERQDRCAPLSPWGLEGGPGGRGRTGRAGTGRRPGLAAGSGSPGRGHARRLRPS